MQIDIERLRSDLILDIGAALSFMPAAMGDVFDLETADADKIIRFAQRNGYNLDDYRDDYAWDDEDSDYEF